MTTATTTVETVAAPHAGAPTVAANYNRTDNVDGLKDTEFLYEDEPQEPDYTKIPRSIALVKDEHLDLHAEMSMAISLAKKYGGIGTVCRALGVSETAARTVGFVGLSRISISDTRYEPSEDGPLAVILPIADAPWGEGPEVYDLLAFLKDTPNRCWSRLGNARCLGHWHLRNAVPWITTLNDDQEPVTAFRSPLEWLQGDCNGFCCLNEDWLSVETVGVPSIQPANGDVVFGRKLKRLLHQQARLPKIVIPKAAT